MKYLLVLICIFFLFTRFYKIAEIPPSVYWDEASIGYNAYSIAETGKDEWGDFLPLHFRAFGEFKLPVYIYSVVPFVKLFGLNELSVRFPAVLYSLGVVVFTYLLARRLTGSNVAGLWSSFLISISPWFFIFSRTGFEATAGLMFYLLAIYLFLCFSKELGKLRLFRSKNGIFIFLSTTSFILSAYSYNSFRVIIPLTILILVLHKRNNFLNIVNRQLKWVILSLVVVTISIWPIYRLYVYDVGFFRLQAVGTVTTATFIKNYFSHFNLDFLLFGDKNLRHQQKGFGQIYLPELVLIVLGILYMMNRKLKYGILMLVFLFLGPIPAALTRESPHALRALSMVPFISMISAMGVTMLKLHLDKGATLVSLVKLRYLFDIGVIIVLLGFFINYFINFINVYPLQSVKDWQYGYKNFFTEYKNELPKYDRVLVSDEFAQPYIFALFYLKYNPARFQHQVVRNPVDKWGFSTVSKFGKFEFGEFGEFSKEGVSKTLIFVSKNEVYEK